MYTRTYKHKHTHTHTHTHTYKEQMGHMTSVRRLSVVIVKTTD